MHKALKEAAKANVRTVRDALVATAAEPSVGAVRAQLGTATAPEQSTELNVDVTVPSGKETPATAEQRALTEQTRSAAAKAAPSDSNMLQCPPKMFNNAKRFSKGTLQIFSPYGAKVFCGEMAKAESLTILFNALSFVMPIIAPYAKKVKKIRFGSDYAKTTTVNPRTGEKGNDLLTNTLTLLHSPTNLYLSRYGL